MIMYSIIVVDDEYIFLFGGYKENKFTKDSLIIDKSKSEVK